jgi:hypothetical protein
MYAPRDIQPPNESQSAQRNDALCIAALEPMTKLGQPQARHGRCAILTIRPEMLVLGAVVLAVLAKSPSCRCGRCVVRNLMTLELEEESVSTACVPELGAVNRNAAKRYVFAALYGFQKSERRPSRAAFSLKRRRCSRFQLRGQSAKQYRLRPK